MCKCRLDDTRSALRDHPIRQEFTVQRKIQVRNVVIVKRRSALPAQARRGAGVGVYGAADSRWKGVYAGGGDVRRVHSVRSASLMKSVIQSP